MKIKKLCVSLLRSYFKHGFMILLAGAIIGSGLGIKYGFFPAIPYGEVPTLISKSHIFLLWITGYVFFVVMPLSRHCFGWWDRYTFRWHFFPEAPMKISDVLPRRVGSNPMWRGIFL